MRKEIISRFPAGQISRYIEVFGGAGWVLFGKPQQPGQLEVYNDIDGDLVNLYRCVKYHCEELQRELSGLPDARECFFDIRHQLEVGGLTDIQRAARYYYIIRVSYGCDKQTYKTSEVVLDRGINYLPQVQERLRKVKIEHRDFAPLIRTYDRPDALIYCDPPYVDTEHYYDAPFTRADHERLAAVLGAIKGRFILSYNDDPYIRQLYDGCTIEGLVRGNHLASQGNTIPYREIIIRNY